MLSESKETSPCYTSEELDIIRYARAEILHIAEPEDSCINRLIELCGAVQTAHWLSGRIGPDYEHFSSLLADSVGGEEAQQLYANLLKRISAWQARRVKHSLEKELKFAAQSGSWLVIPEDPDWPTQLSDLDDTAPFALWGRGERAKLADLRLERLVAVVGSRDTTSYGNSATSHLTGRLAEAGKTIVSGGAFGIDALAHRTALATSSSNLPTVALMACGVDRAYPKHNEPLIQEIYRQGLVLSEVSLGCQPTRWRFLQRNRLIAALSAMTIVIEARWRSGALNTAHHALKIGRELRAVPGPIFSPSSEGCHRLIRDGKAQLITSAQEALDDLSGKLFVTEESLFASARPQLPEMNQAQQKVWDALPLRQYVPVDSLTNIAGANSRSLMTLLSQLAQMGLAEQDSGGWRKSKAYLKIAGERR